jgi:hypothetical protein
MLAAHLVKDPEALLLAWSSEYSFRDNEILECYSQTALKENEARLWEYCQEHKIESALTLYSGSNRVAPFVKGITLGAMYVHADLKQVARALDWKPVPSGANFMLLKPYDDFVMRNAQSCNSWLFRVVSDIQLYLDLAGHRWRGADAAEFLLERRIRPQWQSTGNAMA